jgi:UDP-N-acetylglucosamine 4,6-dehydratase
MEIVGKRPGEKVHELMVGEDDASNTVEHERYFAILPTAKSWSAKDYIEKNGGVMCTEGFRYSSETNTEWLTVEQLETMIGSVADSD